MIFLFRLFFFTALISISILAVLPDYSTLPPIVSISDLINHATAFSVLYFLYSLAYAHTPRRIALTLAAYGIMIEIVQIFLPTRFASLEDLMADCGGIVIGFVIVKITAPLAGKIDLK